MAPFLKRARLFFNNLSNHLSGNSRSVTSNQEGIHPDLEVTIKRHLQKTYQKPVPEYVNDILDQIEKKRQEIRGNLILDSGCGIGASTIKLAEQFPDDLVVGIDQSENRLSKSEEKNNTLFFRANLIDVWLLMEKNKWKVDQHYLLYPNPWPKKKHLQRRWHGHPVFPSLLNLGGKLELRSNWKIYMDEFSQAVEIVTNYSSSVEEFIPSEILTPFEKKYHSSGQKIYRYGINVRSL